MLASSAALSAGRSKSVSAMYSKSRIRLMRVARSFLAASLTSSKTKEGAQIDTDVGAANPWHGGICAVR